MNLTVEQYYTEVERLLKEVVPARFSSQPRPGQIDMALAVAHAFQEGHTLAVEAGTGVGKSLAYLIPAVLWRLNGGDVAPVVSTKTINLQGQLIKKDIPAVQQIMREQYGCEFTVARALGKSNYLCRRRLANALQRRNEWPVELRRLLNGIASIINRSKSYCDDTIDLFEDELEAELMGTKDEFSDQDAIWSNVCCDTWLCTGRKCNYYNKCFLWAARRKLLGADLVVANHALILADAALRRDGGEGVLPPLKYLILDEAHNLEDVATDHLGYSFTRSDCNYLLNRLIERQVERQGEPALLTQIAEAAGLVSDESCRQDLVSIMDRLEYSCLDNLNGALEVYFSHLHEKCRAIDSQYKNIPLDSKILDDDTDGISLREEAQEIDRLLNECSSLLGEIAHCSGLAEAGLDGLTEAAEFAKNQVNQLENALQVCLDCDNPEWVNWAKSRKRLRTSLGQESDYEEADMKVAPLEIGSYVKQYLFDDTNALVLTSATLQVNRSMHFFLQGVGLLPNGEQEEEKGVRTMVCASPFNYRRQAFLGVATDRVEPQTQEQYRVCLGELVRLVKAIGGRTLMLFTSHVAMKTVAEELTSLLLGSGITVLMQKGNNREAIVDQFRHEQNCVLCGMESFWEGVDVPGEALLCVVIFKLPFPVFTEPIHLARSEKIDRETKDSFNNYLVPLTITKLRQGTGRLIRSETDKGIILLLDSRVKTKRYGSTMLNALPACTCQHKPLRELVDNGLLWLGRSETEGRFTE